MEHQKCYIYTPPTESEPPAKKRKVNESGLQASWRLREKTFQELWGQQEKRIQTVLDNANQTTLTSISNFVAKAAEQTEGSSKIPIGLIVAGPSIASHGTFFSQLSDRIVGESRTCFVSISSSECPNLKTLLSTLIKKATARRSLDEDDEGLITTSSRKGPRLLSYDLQLLYDYVQETGKVAVVIAFQDSEAFDGFLISEVASVLSAWKDRVPFVLLFGIGTSVENFHDKLPRSTLRNLQGEQFDVVQAEEILEKVFWTTVCDEDTSLRLGPSLAQMLLEAQKDHLQSVEAFVEAVKYAFMSHFFANPVSVFLYADLEFSEINEDHIEAIRRLPSFRKLAEELLAKNQPKELRSLLEDDGALFDFAVASITSGQQELVRMIQGIQVVDLIRSCISKTNRVSRSTLYVKAASGELHGSASLRELLLSVKKSPSDVLSNMLDVLIDSGIPNLPEAWVQIQEDLESLAGSTEKTLRSEHDIRNETLRTTVVAQKVELSKQKSTLSKNDSAYSKLLATFQSTLEAFFEECFARVGDMFLSEVLMYDVRGPHRATFAPKTRFAVERALSAPHDYLGCECCKSSSKGGEEDGLSSTQPPTAILYQLYLESGTLINVHDLWNAFHAIVAEDDEDDQSKSMALFQRALAELKYLGLIKASRKKTDHIAKLTWKGL
ncbi:origin recognition complex subunit [Aulographum hederae CBS 113979]|uniref:Origin recognition complex subunit n=1 Tax=Aulographum hederae CBS 113979 TaxID=1176131 RepID=A0A6G1GKF6_9PEZI|nr:origin recognition complex subunit [Aulographum hederae CBS 113979]